MTSKPMLEGVRILAVEQYGAGPFGTLFLADLGAEVIKVENKAEGGDVSRVVGPHFHAALPETARSVFYQGLNRSKKSIALDLARPEGKAVFHRLVAHADAVASNLRGDVPAKLGITYPQLAAANPKIVCAHLTGYGREGERAAWPGYDYMMQAEAGYFHLTGDPDSSPARFGLSLVDLMTGVVLAAGAPRRAARREPRRARARRRREPLRPRARQPELHRPLVPQRRRRDRPHRALRARVDDAVPELPHARRLDLPDVQQGEVLGRALPQDRAAAVDRRRALPDVSGPAAAPGAPHRADRRGAPGAHDRESGSRNSRAASRRRRSTTSPRRSRTRG